MLLLQQLLGLPQDQQQIGAGSNQDAPSAPPSTDHQEQSQSPPPPPPTQQQGAPPPPIPSAPGHPHQQTPPPPPQQNQFCSNCSGSRGRQDDCRQYLENMIPIILTLFSIWAFHRTVVQKRPLFNMNYWKRNFSTHCHRHFQLKIFFVYQSGKNIYVFVFEY